MNNQKKFFLACIFLFILIFFSGKNLGAVELIQNGGFSNGLSYWNINEQAKYSANPLFEPVPESGDFKLNLHPDSNYFGLVVYQPFNVTNVSGKTITLNMQLTNVWNVVDGSTVNAYIAYVTITNNVVQQKIAGFQNSSINEPDKNVSATYTLPSTGIKKIIGFGISKEGYGEFLVDNISLDISGSPVIGPLPRITNVDKNIGPYGSIITITGQNFGNTQGLTSIVTVGDTEEGISVLSWSNTQVVIKIDDPAIDGSIVVVNDFVPSNNDNKFKITSPNYQIFVDNQFKTYIKGSMAKFFINVYFENGYSTTSGINFIINGESTSPEITNNIISFKNTPVKIEGSAVLEIDTSNLNEGIYNIEVVANDGVMQQRYSGIFILQVVKTGNIKIFYNGIEVTEGSIDISRQYSFNLYYQIFDMSNNIINPPSFFEQLNLNIESSNSDLLTVYKEFWGETFYANDNGTATLTFKTPDNYQKTLTVNISIPDQPKVTLLGISPDVIENDPNNNLGQSFNFNAYYNTTGNEVGWGMYGMYDVDWNNVNVTWGENSASAEGSWVIRGYLDTTYNYRMPLKIGIGLINASCYGIGENNSVIRVKKLNIINKPGTATVSGSSVSAGGFGEMFYIEFYDTNGNFLFPRLAESHHFQEFTVGFIPLGIYKMKFVFNGNAKDYWYGGSYTFDDAQSVNLSSNPNFKLPYVVASENMSNIPWVNPVRKDFGTAPLNQNVSQTFIFRNNGIDNMTISGISIEGGNGAFSAEHNCPGILSPFSECSINVNFLPNSPGQKTAYLKLSGQYPEQGEYIEIPLTGTGQSPIGSGTLTINNDSVYTNSRTVNLAITCTDSMGCSQMCISNDTPDCTTFITFATTKSWTLSLGDGTKTVYVKLKNKNNQIGDSFSDTIILDTLSPVSGTLNAIPSDQTVNLSWDGFIDLTSGISQYAIYGGTTLPSSCSQAPLYSGTELSYIHSGLTNGITYYYRLCVYDNAGNLNSSVTASAKPVPETDPPTLNKFTINNGANYTKLNTVSLQVSASDESSVSQMCISNTNICANWVSYVTNVNSWSLTTGYGQKTVYIWFRDIWGNTNSSPYQANIVVDNVAPVDNPNSLIITPLSGENENSINIEWYPAYDANSYIKEYRVIASTSSTGVSSCSKTPIAVIDIAPNLEILSYTHTGLLAGKTYYYRVCAVDVAGNISVGKTGSAKPIDTIGPQSPWVLINDDNIYTKSTTVTLKFNANDQGGIAKVCIGNTPTSFSCSTFNPLLPQKTWRLPTPSGEKTVYVKFIDGAGNESNIVNDSIYLDVVKPIDGKLTGISGNGFVILSWGQAVEAGGSGMDRYIVKLGTTSYPSCTTGDTLYEGLDLSFVHNGLANGSSYYYRVCAIDKAGNISAGKTYLGKPNTLTTITGSFPIATTSKREQALRVAFDGTNYALALKGVGTSTNSIGVQFLTKDGVKIGSPLILSGLSGVEPQISYGNGKYLVVWSDDNTKTIRGQLINSVTRILDGSPFDISQSALSAGCIDTYANPVFDGNNFFVIWNYDAECTEDGSGHDVFGRFVDNYGGMVGGIINLIDGEATGRQEYHTMTFDGENIYVFWEDARREVLVKNPCDNSDMTGILTDIYGQIVSKSNLSEPGVKIGANFPVYEGENPVDFEIFGSAYNGNSVNVVWQNFNLACSGGNLIDIGSSNIKMAEVNIDGTISGIFDITMGNTSKNMAPLIESSKDGTVFITWHDMTNMNDIEIKAQIYTQDGIPLIDPFLLVSKSGNQFGGVVSFDNNKFFILWNDKIGIDFNTGSFIFGDVYGALISPLSILK